jgi:adenylate kinase
LSIRADDAPDVVRSRLELYHNLTEPLKHYYQDTGKLVLVIGAEEVAETKRRTLEALGIE